MSMKYALHLADCAKRKAEPLSPSAFVVVTCPPGEDRCKQSEKSDCDIATIISKYGALPPAPVTPLTYADISALPDYRSALNSVVHAESLFANLPLALRERFMNDPGRFVNFVSDASNLEEMQRLGLAVKPPVVIAPPPAPAGGAAPGVLPPVSPPTVK